MQELHLNVEQQDLIGSRRRLTRLTCEDRQLERTIFHESEWLPDLNGETLLDGHVLCVLLYAMQTRMPLVVEGSVSQGFMRNAWELQRAWARWRPQRYQVVEIRASRVVDVHATGEHRALAAFSGGADAMFTALSHTRLKPRCEAFPLTHLLMIHGFDVPLDDDGEFRKLVGRVTPFVDELGLKLMTMKTNSRDAVQSSWEDSHLFQIASGLHMFHGMFDSALVGSSEAYDALVIPWGSSPITDHLTSSDLMQVIHDGAGYSRTEKIAAIAEFPTASRAMKVCWEGPRGGENCGRCEKCMRTKMNFLAAGRPIPACFSEGLDVDAIARIEIRGEVQRGEFRSILQYARSQGLTADWTVALSRRINRPSKDLLHRCVPPVLEALGLKEPVKQMRSWWRGGLPA